MWTRRGATASVALAWLCCASVARGQTDGAERIERAARCYAQLDYDCVLESLEGFDAAELSETLPRDRVELGGQVLAVTFVIRGLPEAGRAVFVDLLERWPDYELREGALAPRFFDVFYSARAEVRGRARADLGDTARALAVRHAAAAAGERAALGTRDRVDAVLLAIAIPDPRRPRAGPALRLALGIGHRWLTGDDRDVWDDGFGFSGRVGSDVLLGLALSIAVDYTTHAVTLANVIDSGLESLSVLDVSLNIGYPMYVGPVRIALSGGVGYSAFGHRSLGERGGLSLEAAGDVSVSTRSGLGVGLELRQRLLVVDESEGFALSSPVVAALHLTYELRLD